MKKSAVISGGLVFVLWLAIWPLRTSYNERAGEFAESTVDQFSSIAAAADLEVAKTYSARADDGRFGFSESGWGPSEGRVKLTMEPIGRITGPEMLIPLVNALAQNGFEVQVEHCLGSGAQSALFRTTRGDTMRVRIGNPAKGEIEFSATLSREHKLTNTEEVWLTPRDPGCWPDPS